MTGPEPPKLKTWEIDVEVRVRKTLLLRGLLTEAAAREAAQLITTQNGPDIALNTSQFLKWTDDRTVHRPMPVEIVIDNDPTIVAVREMPDA